MNKEQLYIMFSYELLKSELSESDFGNFLKSESKYCKEVYTKRSSLDAKRFTDLLYASFLSDIFYIRFLSLDENYWHKPFFEKINTWIQLFGNLSEFIKIFTNHISRLNKFEVYDFISQEISATTDTEKIYITLPQFDTKMVKDLVSRLRNKSKYISPVFMIDEELIGGLKIQFKESLCDYSWKNQISSKLL